MTFNRTGTDLHLEVPVLNIDLEVTNNEAWDEWTSYVPCFACNDVTFSITGFWGKDSQMQLTVYYTGAPKVGTATFTSTADNEDGAVLELNSAIKDLFNEYLPTQGWQLV